MHVDLQLGGELSRLEPVRLELDLINKNQLQRLLYSSLVLGLLLLHGTQIYLDLLDLLLDLLLLFALLCY